MRHATPCRTIAAQRYARPHRRRTRNKGDEIPASHGLLKDTHDPMPDPNTLRPSPTLIMDRRVHTRRLLWVIHVNLDAPCDFRSSPNIGHIVAPHKLTLGAITLAASLLDLASQSRPLLMRTDQPEPSANALKNAL